MFSLLGIGVWNEVFEIFVLSVIFYCSFVLAVFF